MYLANDGTPPGFTGGGLLVPRFIFHMVLSDFPNCIYRVCLRKSVSNKRYRNTLINYRVEDTL